MESEVGTGDLEPPHVSRPGARPADQPDEVLEGVIGDRVVVQVSEETREIERSLRDRMEPRVAEKEPVAKRPETRQRAGNRRDREPLYETLAATRGQ